MTPALTHDQADDLWIDRVVEDCAAIYLEVHTWLWRLCGLIGEAVIIAVVIFIAQTSGGMPIAEAMENVATVAFFYLLGRAVLLMIADFISNRLAQLIRWWRRR